jgi:hypothetical protein
LSSSSKGAVEGPSASHSIWWGTSTFDSWLIAAAAQVFLPSLSYISSTLGPWFSRAWTSWCTQTSRVKFLELYRHPKNQKENKTHSGKLNPQWQCMSQAKHFDTLPDV